MIDFMIGLWRKSINVILVLFLIIGGIIGAILGTGIFPGVGTIFLAAIGVGVVFIFEWLTIPVFYILFKIDERLESLVSITRLNNSKNKEIEVLNKIQDTLQKSETNENTAPEGLCIVNGRHLIRRDGKYYCPKCNSLTTESYSSCSNCGTSFM